MMYDKAASFLQDTEPPLEESYYFTVYAYEIYPPWPDGFFIFSWFMEQLKNSKWIKREIKKQMILS